MKIYKKKRNLLVCFSIIMCLLSSCIPAMDSVTLARFKNCTNDTLFVGVSSYYNNIDSANCMLEPKWYYQDSILCNNKDICLWNDIRAGGKKIYPDSIGKIYDYMLFYRNNTDTCFFFLIRNEDVKNHSWDEIRAKKLYKKWITVRNKEGEFDTNIKYTEENE